MTQAIKPLSAAGNVDIETLRLISSNGLVVDLEDYLIELNLFEDIFASTLHGNIMISDSRNLITNLLIRGQEMLLIKLTTPTLGVSIEKAFRVFAVTDRKAIRDTNTQTYLLHFCSQEAVIDSLLPLYRPYSGKITSIVENIYTSFLSVPRNMIPQGDTYVTTDETTGLVLLNDTENKAEYISPGWSPIKNINWLASKAMPVDGKASNFLFWETSKSFYFGSIDFILKQYKEKEVFFGIYTYSPSGLKESGVERQKGQDVNKEMFLIDNYDIVDQFDEISNYSDGYYASSVYAFDINRKSLEYYVYDHLESFKDHNHTERENVFALQYDNTARNPESLKFFSSRGKYLFNGTKDNVGETYPRVYGRRRSTLKDFSNLRMNLTVPGRTDLECGMVIYVSIPSNEPRSEEDFAKDIEDPIYSGFYLITAIRHKITLLEHRCVLEVAKDSISIKD